MSNYNCEICNYNTKLRTDYKRHLSTKSIITISLKQTIK